MHTCGLLSRSVILNIMYSHMIHDEKVKACDTTGHLLWEKLYNPFWFCSIFPTIHLPSLSPRILLSLLCLVTLKFSTMHLKNEGFTQMSSLTSPGSKFNCKPSWPRQQAMGVLTALQVTLVCSLGTNDPGQGSWSHLCITGTSRYSQQFSNSHLREGSPESSRISGILTGLVVPMKWWSWRALQEELITVPARYPWEWPFCLGLCQARENGRQKHNSACIDARILISKQSYS